MGSAGSKTGVFKNSFVAQAAGVGNDYKWYYDTLLDAAYPPGEQPFFQAFQLRHAQHAVVAERDLWMCGLPNQEAQQGSRGSRRSRRSNK